MRLLTGKKKKGMEDAEMNTDSEDQAIFYVEALILPALEALCSGKKGIFLIIICRQKSSQSSP